MVQLGFSGSLVFFALAALRIVSAFEFTVGVGKDETTGKKGIGFDPSVIYTQAGDVITFVFRSGAHSVVQSTFETPCIPKDGGYDSGVHTVDDSVDVDSDDLPSEKMTVNATGPMWFFDRAGGACFKGGVLAVSPNDTQTAQAFKSNAAHAGDHVYTTASTSASGSASSPTATDPTAINQSNGFSNANPATLGIAAIIMGSSLLLRNVA